MRRFTLPFLALTALHLSGCLAGDGHQPGDQEASVTDEAGPEVAVSDGETMDEGTSLEAIFLAAADEFGVPAPVLESVGWVESRWQMVEGHTEFDGQAPAYGIMGLRGERLLDAADLAELDPELVKTDPEANIRAAAALLASYGAEMDAVEGDPGSWARAIAEYSGIESLEGQASYIQAEVYATMKKGMVTEAVNLPSVDVTPSFVQMDASSNPGPDYAPAIWRPSPNYSSRPSGSKGDPTMVIIHTCEGSYSGCWSWLHNSASGVSAHYVVSSTGNEITQLVKESKKAWHIAATYDCSRNSGEHCDLNGFSSNNFTIGIEHAGHASQSSWSSGLLDESAKLSCDIAKDNNIPIDKFHFVGHGQLQPWNRVDPGPNWPWDNYIAQIDSHCGGGNTPDPTDPTDPTDPSDPSDPMDPGGDLTIVVDSNNSLNDSDAQCVVSGNWTASSNVGGYFNTGYWWRSTGSSSDLAEFKAHLDSPKTMVVEAWWPAASDRSSSAPFIIFDGNGNQLDTVYVNQKTNGGQWVTLGTYDFTAGWNSVALSRWTTPGSVVVADAVRFREVQ